MGSATVVKMASPFIPESPFWTLKAAAVDVDHVVSQCLVQREEGSVLAL